METYYSLILLFCPDWQVSPLTAIFNPFIFNVITMFECKSTALLLAFYFSCVSFFCFLLFLPSFTVEYLSLLYLITSLGVLLSHFVLFSAVVALRFMWCTFNLSQFVFRQCYTIYTINIINLNKVIHIFIKCSKNFTAVYLYFPLLFFVVILLLLYIL